MRRYSNSVSSVTTGIPVYQAQIRVLKADTSAAQLYSDNGITTLSQPVLSDGTGFFSFFVADGTYTIVIADPDGSNPRSFPNTEIYEDARNVSVPVGEPGLTLPSAAARAGKVQTYDGSGNPTVTAKSDIGGTGPAGPANVLSVGTVTKVAAGGTPTVSITGTSPAQTLNVGLVTGDTGATGSAGATGPAGYTSTDTWAHLNAITPSGGAGSTGFAVGPDTGTHTDANGATLIPNTGQFSYQASPAGWIRIGSALGPSDPAAIAPLFTALAGYADTVTTFGFGQSTGGLAQSDSYNLYVHPAVPDLGHAVPQEIQYIDVTIKTVGDGTSKLVVERATVTALTPNYFDQIVIENVTGITTTGPMRLLAGVNFPSGIQAPAGSYVGFFKYPGSVAFGYQNTGGTYTAQYLGGSTHQMTTFLTYQLSATVGLSNPKTVIAKTAALDVSAAQAVLYQVNGWRTRKIGGQPQAASGTGAHSTVGPRGFATFTGKLTGIEYYGVTSGTGIFDLYRGSQALVADNVHVASWTATVVGGGAISTWSLPEEVDWTTDSFLMWTGITGAIGILNTVMSGIAPNDRLWRNGAFFEQASEPQMRPVIRAPITDQEVFASRNRGATVKMQTSFTGTTTPTGWDAPAQMTVNNGLIASGSPTMNSGALISGHSMFDCRLATMQFTIVNTNIKMGIGSSPPFYALGGAHGTDILLDGTAGAAAAVIRMYLRIGTNGASYLDSGISFAVPWTIAAGRHFLAVQTTALSITVTLSDTQGHSVTFEKVFDNLTPVGRFKGKAGVVYRSGAASSFTVENFTLTHGIGASPQCVMFGDSNLEGTGPAFWWDQGFRTYGRLLETRRSKGDLMICAAGGQSIDQATATIPYELAGLTPRHIIWDLLTNDLPAGQAAIRTSLLAAITALRTACPNAEIHLMTAKPFPTYQTAINAINADIRSHYFETTLGIPWFRNVEVTKRLTTAHDDTAWNPYYVCDGGAHASYAGEQVIADAIAMDLPDLVSG